MKRLIVFLIVLVSTASLGGCTVRYSQTVTGSIQRVESFKVVNSASGTDIGLDLLRGTPTYKIGQGIAFSDPKGPAELADYPCNRQMVEVDYRSKWYAYYIRAEFPQTTITSYCIKEK